MGTVLVIFSFLWTDNDLVNVALPQSGTPHYGHHNYAHT